MTIMKYCLILSGILLASSMTLLSCNDDFLERQPLDEVGAGSYFTKPMDLEIYMNQYYNASFFPKYPNHGGDYNSDNMVASTPDVRLQGTRTVATTGTIGLGNVRSLNYFLTDDIQLVVFHDFNENKQ